MIEGGLARHVRKLAEALVRQGVGVDVLTRGNAEAPSTDASGPGRARRRERASRARAGLAARPRSLRRVGGADERRHAARGRGARPGALLRPRPRPRLARRGRAATLADRLRVPYVTTIHATEHGRHQGWVHEPPQSHIHAVERWMAHRADAVIVCSYYMRGHVADIFDIDERRVAVIPNGVDPSELRPLGDLRSLRGEFAAPHEKLVLLVGRLVYEKGFQLALDALPGVIEQVGDVRFLVAGSGTHEAELQRAGRAPRPARARDVPRLDRRRRAALALPHRRPVRGALDLRAVRARRARGDGLGLPLHRRRHGRPARGGARRRARRACASTAATPSTSA